VNDYQGRKATIAVLEAVAAAILWGTIGVVYKLVVDMGGDGDWLIAGRPLLASTASLALIVTRGRKPSKWSVATGAFGLAPLYLSYFIAVGTIGAALASLLLYTAPLWVVLLSKPLLKESPGLGGVAATIAGFTGVAMLVEPAGTAAVAGVAAGLLAGISYAAYILLARLAQLKGASTEEVAIHSLPFTAIVVLAAIRPYAMLTMPDAIGISYLSIAGTLIPYILNARALKKLEAYRVSIISLVEPLTATILAMLVLGEKLTAIQLAGASLILAASITTMLEKTRRTTRPYRE